MAETPIEMLRLPEELWEMFSGKLPEAAAGTAEERERNFLSRAFPGYAIHKLASCSIEEATAAVVDGGGEGGIDAFHHAAATHILWIPRSKFIFDNARWLVLNLLFLNLRPEQGEELRLTLDEEAKISKTVVDLAGALWAICEAKGYVARHANVPAAGEPYQQARHFRSVFSTAGDCVILRTGLLAKLAGQATVAPITHGSPPGQQSDEVNSE